MIKIGDIVYIPEQFIWKDNSINEEVHAYRAVTYKIISFDEHKICAIRLKYHEVEIYEPEYKNIKLPFYDFSFFDRINENKNFYLSRSKIKELFVDFQKQCGCQKCLEWLKNENNPWTI